MAERLAALVLRQGQTEAVPMSLQRAALAKGQGGAQILTVVNWPKGKSLSKKLFYNKDGKLNAKAQRGMDNPFVNVSKEDTMNNFLSGYVIKPTPTRIIGTPYTPEGFESEDMGDPSPPGDPREVWLARSEQATKDFKEQNQGKPSGIETGLTNLYNMTVDWLRDNNRKGLSRLDALVKLNEEEGVANPQASAVRDFMLTDPSSIFSNQRKNPQSALTRAFGLDSKGTEGIPSNQGQDSVLKVTARTPSGVEGENEQRLPRRKPKAPTREQKGTPITNRNLRDYYDNIERIQSGPITGETVMIEGSDEIYGGATGKSWQEYSKAWQKANKENIKAGMPEDPIKSLFKKATSKKGGGRVSSRPKSYRTAKVMKQYSKGGSVRKPKRI